MLIEFFSSPLQWLLNPHQQTLHAREQSTGLLTAQSAASHILVAALMRAKAQKRATAAAPAIMAAREEAANQNHSQPARQAKDATAAAELMPAGMRAAPTWQGNADNAATRHALYAATAKLRAPSSAMATQGRRSAILTIPIAAALRPRLAAQAARGIPGAAAPAVQTAEPAATVMEEHAQHCQTVAQTRHGALILPPYAQARHSRKRATAEKQEQQQEQSRANATPTEPTK